MGHAKALKQRNDVNEIAAMILDMSTAAPGKNPLAVALGRRGGLKGGQARKRSLSPARRTAIARKAAKTRWAKKKGGSS
jgi:hypothetical protein